MVNRKKVIKIDGGIGRCIALSGVAKEGDIVVTSYPEVFFGRQNLRVYPLSHPYLFEDIVLHNNWVEVEPYNSYMYYRNKEHISDVFHKLIYGDEESNHEPILEILDHEKEAARLELVKIKGDKRGVVLFQPFGSNYKRDISKRSMSIEFAQKVVNTLNEEGYKVLYVKGEEHPDLENVYIEQMSLRKLFAIGSVADKFICVDSFLQHLVGAYKKKGLVFWTGTDVVNLGYNCNLNINVGEPITFANRIPVNDPNISNLNYDWNDDLLEEVREYITEENGNIRSEEENTEDENKDRDDFGENTSVENNDRIEEERMKEVIPLNENESSPIEEEIENQENEEREEKSYEEDEEEIKPLNQTVTNTGY